MAEVALLLFPTLLLAGVVVIPFVWHFGDHAAAERGARRRGRWAAGHLLTAAAFGVGIAAAGRLADYLLDYHLLRLAVGGLIFAAIGGGLLAAGMGLDGIGPLLFANIGRKPRDFFDSSRTIVPAIFVIGTLLFGAGQIMLVAGINQTGLLPAPLAVTAMLAAILFAVLPAIPSSLALYLTAIASSLIYFPIAAALTQPHV